MSFGSNFLYYSVPYGIIPFNYQREGMELLAGIKNTDGSYRSGYINIAYSGWGCRMYSNPVRNTCNTGCIRYHQKINTPVGNKIALLIMPKNSLNHNQGIGGLNKQYAIEKYNREPYMWNCIMLSTYSASEHFTSTEMKISSSSDSIWVESGDRVSDDYPKYANETVKWESTLPWTGFYTLLYMLNDIGVIYKNVGIEDYHKYTTEVIESVQSQMEELKTKYTDLQTIFNNVHANDFNFGFLDGSLHLGIASQIDASFPIFLYNDLDAVYRYFKTGEIDATNNDDLILSETGIATDWKVYVNGERKPSIYVTMNSKAIEEYIKSTDNKGGYGKEDFKTEYKADVFDIKGNATQHTFIFKETDTLPRGVYDNQYPTSWEMLTDINYPDKAESNGGLWLGSKIDDTEFYAQLKFRVSLNNKIFSSWCEFSIGVIGSPSVPDFAQMRNWALVDGISDGSTIELIYDQTPPGEDDYEDPPDDVPEPSDTAPSDYDLGGVGLTQTYKVDDIQLQQLGGYLWGATFIDNIKLVNNNPIENIIGCKRIPFDIPAGVARNIVMGNVTAPASGNIVSSLPIIDIGSVKYNGYYGNFLDYAPYTRLILFLPFCGFTEVDPSVITGKTMSIKYAIDVIMGKCRAMLFVDGAYYSSYDGNFAVEIPLTGSNRAQVEMGLVSSAVGAVAGAVVPSMGAMQGAKAAVKYSVAGNVTGGITSLLDSAVAAQYHSTRTGSYSSTCAWQETRKCFMIADIPTCQYPSSYGHDIGYPCKLTKTLATMRGFTQCGGDIDMSGLTCTEEEMDMIREYLTAGVYL